MNAPTWVLLRGLARDSRHWESFPSRLAVALGAGARVLTPDLPGNGSLHHQRSPATVAAMVESYREQLPAGQRVHVLGLSLGAMVAIEWAHRYPQEIASLVVVNGSSAAISPPWLRMRPKAAWALAGAILPWRSLEAREDAIVRVCSNLAGHQSVASRWARYAREAHTSPGNAARQLIAALRYRVPDTKPDVPALAIGSTSDRLVSVECSIAIARRWDWPLLLHPTAGHELALDDPGWLARQCARWQAGLDGLEHLRS
jgi:pimeloyl-ACP methyl ester carboxylesterase